MAIEQHYDVAIIGGGPAGLNAALLLGRARRKVVVIDEGKPRNKVTAMSYGFLTRDQTPPSELRAIALEQLARYPSVQFWKDTAVSAESKNGAFHLMTALGRDVRSRKLLFVTGMKDSPITITGLEDVYGISAFVCPYCDGWELRDKQLAIIAKGKAAYHFARMLPGWSSTYFICTNGEHEMTEEQLTELTKRKIPLYTSPIRTIVSSNGAVRQIELQDGQAIECESIFFAPHLIPGSELPNRLGCEVTDTGMLVVDHAGRTNVAGVYSAGDAASIRYQAIMAAASGALAATAINNELLKEDWDGI